MRRAINEILERGEPVMFAGGRGMESEPCERDADKHDRASNSGPSINAARCVARGEATQGEGLGSLRSLPSPHESSARHNPRRGSRPSRVPNRRGRLVASIEFTAAHVTVTTRFGKPRSGKGIVNAAHIQRAKPGSRPRAGNVMRPQPFRGGR